MAQDASTARSETAPASRSAQIGPEIGPEIDTDYRLADKYERESGRVFLTGSQALVRVPLMQIRRDRATGLNTGGFISGYRGSPLGGFDQQLWQARKLLQEHDIHFVPGVNEELGATAVWGSQQVNLWPGGRKDGVVGLWYGKGPGVDRSGDVFKHANFAGTARHGGVLALAGDDHACKSSTVPHQSEQALIAAMTPVLNPANVQEILDLSLYGIALSRYAGLWVGLKTIAETLDSSGSVYVGDDRTPIRMPDDHELPPGGLSIRWPDAPMVQEERLIRHKLAAVRAFVRANGLDRVMLDGPRRRIGIVTVGKAYLDVRQALADLGLSDPACRNLGLSIYKVAMPWPLEPEGLRAFADRLDEIVVVEEKRPLIEGQIKEHLYGWRADARPVVVGKADETGADLFPSMGELAPAQIAAALGRRLLRHLDATEEPGRTVAARVAALEAADARKLVRHPGTTDRVPFFCSGCPHNTSTRVPEGSVALAGIGCHYMATWMDDRPTKTFSQMGGEGAAWIGAAPFAGHQHVFVNLGDGTYFHSGVLAIRAAVAAGVTVTYKLLFNDAVAMTGGQPVDGQLTPQRIAHQLRAEGVETIVVVTDEPERYGAAGMSHGAGLPADVVVEDRRDLDRVQRDLRERRGVSVMIYDQTCAAEKRRRRKRKTYPDPPKRAVINELVCEGCGDCSKKSNCLSVVPVETEFGRKRGIDQSSCNKDFSCVEGFCPSFVTVHGGTLKKPKAATGASDAAWADLPEPTVPAVGDTPYGILVTGIGGTGVVTIGALLGMAAHLEGKGCSVLDQAGLAQKGGAVTSHIRIGAAPEDLHAARIAAAGASLVLGCDLVVAANPEQVSKIAPGRTRAILNTHGTITAAFTQNPDVRFPTQAMVDIVREAAGGTDRVDTVDATTLATRLLGDSIATNLFMVGYAWQRGLIPLSRVAIEQAVALNGVAIKANLQAFEWGRRAAHDLQRVVDGVASGAGEGSVERPGRRRAETLDQVIDQRVAFLTDYQDAAYAATYRAFVDRVRAVEHRMVPELLDGPEAKDASLTGTVARYLFKLMAYKDEYEVARLYTDGSFRKQLEDTFEGPVTLEFHLAPPAIADRDPETGELKKRRFGPWMLRAFAVLAKLKWLRGTRFDPFGYSAERRIERALPERYRDTVEMLLAGLEADPSAARHALAVQIAAVPEHIRGYGHVKARHLSEAEARERDLLAQFQALAARPPEDAPRLAAE